MTPRVPLPSAAPRALARRGRSRAILLVAATLVSIAVLMLLLAPRGAGAQDAAATPAKPVARTAARTTPRAAPRAASRAAADSSLLRIEREVYGYAGTARRDPFRSLLTTSELRPLMAELRLAAVAVDPDGENSVAILRDLTTKAQYRVRVGQLLGRMRVARIHRQGVVFTIEELGYSRQETLALADSTVARTK